MYLDIVDSIDEKRVARFLPIQVKPHGHTEIDGPQKGCAGIYFFYTSYSDDELASVPALPGRAVPIGKLTKAHRRLPYSCSLEQEGFRLVYNGIGGFNGGSYDLRTRILQEISSTDERTGSLCIRQSTVDDLSKWRFSYVTLYSEKQKSKSDFGAEWSFEDHAIDLERCWRLVHGWPLLCRT
jgi:hypothetical protein